MNAEGSATTVASAPWRASVLGRHWHEAVALTLLLVAMAVLALRELGDLSLWRDEVASVVFAKGSLGDLLNLVDRNRDSVGLANMATYYLLLHFWLALGESEAQIRLLSVIFGVASVVPVYFIGRRLAGWMAGALAAGIYVLIPYAIHYSQEARGYSMATLAAGLLTWLVLIGVDRRRAWPWLAYGLVAAVGLYVHFFIGLVVAAHGAWLLATRQVPPLMGALAAVVPILLALVPIPFIISEFGGTQEWIPPLTWELLGRELPALAGSQPLLLAFTVLGAVAIGLNRRDPRIWLLVACVVLPIVGAALVSLIKPIFIGRYLVVVLPHVALLAAAGIMVIHRPVVRVGATAAMAALLLFALPAAYADVRQQDWRGAGAWIAAAAQPGDQIVAAGPGRRSILYYLDRAGHEPLPTSKVGTAIEDDVAQRIWVPIDETAADTSARSRLEQSFGVIQEREFGDSLTVLLMTRSAGGSG